MDEFLKMDIFFVVSTLMTILLGGLFALVLWRLLQLLKTLQRLADTAEREANAIVSFFELAIGRVGRFFSGKKKKD